MTYYSIWSINLYGKESSNEEVEVDREGRLVIDKLQPVTVTGMQYSEVVKLIKTKVMKNVIFTILLSVLFTLAAVAGTNPVTKVKIFESEKATVSIDSNNEALFRMAIYNPSNDSFVFETEEVISCHSRQFFHATSYHLKPFY